MAVVTVPGKTILMGEHAVVYGRPAIAVPVQQVYVKVTVQAIPHAKPGVVHIHSSNIGLHATLAELAQEHPIRVAFQGVLDELGLEQMPASTLHIDSTIPVASGLGSGAAVAVAIIRAVSIFLNHPLPDERVNALAFEVEKIHHGTPSGVDNTVITYNKPVYYVKGQSVQTFRVAMPFTIAIADTRVASPTVLTVNDVRKAWEADKPAYERIFDAIGVLVVEARQAIEQGKPQEMGPLMDENQEYLARLNLSSPELERLIEAARKSGALGAKLSGGGRGGNMIALVTPDCAARVAHALQEAGAMHVILSEVN
jgi:mevalonate kinase